MRTLILAALATIAVGWGIQKGVVDDTIDYLWVTQIGVDRTAGSVIIENITQKARYRAWNELCLELRDIDCSGVAVPKVKTFRPNPFRPGLLGYYDGSDTVYIRNNLYAYDRQEVLAHEMSHYYDVAALGARVPGPALEICFSEKRAWAVSDNFWLRRGYSINSKKIVGSEWTEWYDHCTPHQATLYPDIYGVNKN